MYIYNKYGKRKMPYILRDLEKYTSKEIARPIKENIQESRREWMIWMFEWEDRLHMLPG